MEPLRTLVLAGLRKDKGTFVGLALLLFLAAFALTLTTSLFADLSNREEALLDQIAADRKSTRLNSSHPPESRMPSSA